MTLQTWSVYWFGVGLLWECWMWQAHGLQCYSCNIGQGQRYMDVGCSKPELVTCTHLHKGFKHRFCIKTESTSSGIVLTSGCATSRHCQQQELPGVRIHCCESDLCNKASWNKWSAAHVVCTVAFTILLLLI